MITARQFKNGLVVEIDKKLFQVVHSQHIKPGKGGAFVRAKLKNLKSGSIVESTFRPTDSFDEAFIEEKVTQFLYSDGPLYYFMDQTTYEEIGVSKEILGDAVKFLKDGMEVRTSLHEDIVVGVSLPSFVELKVAYTEPGIKGDTARGGSKAATLETGIVVKVPLFVNTDDIIKIDTRTGEYGGRA
ncbi:MAG: elongation factor P [Candidatus Omnitrophota bacterium]